MSAQNPETHSSFRVALPFDADAHAADMILRSADGTDFRVMKGVLAVSSPIFQDVTCLAKPLVLESTRPSSEVSEEGLPIVTMYESNAVVLDALLRILYPVVPQKIDDISLLTGLLCAAQKYDMDVVLHRVKAELRRMCAEDDGRLAMEVYALACEYKLEDEARLAAHEFLRHPFSSTHFAGLERVSGSALFHLFDYRRNVADKVDAIFSPIAHYNLPNGLSYIIRFIECGDKRTNAANGCGNNENGYVISGWWSALRETARSEVQRAPLSDSVLNFGLISRAACSPRCCSKCQTSVFRSLPTLEPAIKQEINKLASEVKLTLPW